MTEEADAPRVSANIDALLDTGAHARDAAKAFLSEFAAKKGIADSLDEDGMLSAEADGLKMMLVPLEDRPLVLATVELEADLRNEPELARMFLQANLDWTATGGGTFASLGEEEKPHLCRLLFVQAGATDAFAADVAAMFNVASAWSDALEADGEDFDDDEDQDEDTISNAWLKA